MIRDVTDVTTSGSPMWKKLLPRRQRRRFFHYAYPIPILAAQYLRMSTDEQRFSLEYQAKAIAAFAERHGFKVVRSYEDPGKSGLTLKRRPGLSQLLRDVLGADRPFKAVLVYDVSRWGRFQDIDESAHYEFVCRNAGIPVYYCAETFKNNTSAPSAIMKSPESLSLGVIPSDSRPLETAARGRSKKKESALTFLGETRSIHNGPFCPVANRK